MATAEEIWITTMIESLHTGMMVNVRDGREISNAFAITGSHTFLYLFVSNA